jgi:hypothetical protein
MPWLPLQRPGTLQQALCTNPCVRNKDGALLLDGLVRDLHRRADLADAATACCLRFASAPGHVKEQALKMLEMSPCGLANSMGKTLKQLPAEHVCSLANFHPEVAKAHIAEALMASWTELAPISTDPFYQQYDALHRYCCSAPEEMDVPSILPNRRHAYTAIASKNGRLPCKVESHMARMRFRKLTHGLIDSVVHPADGTGAFIVASGGSTSLMLGGKYRMARNSDVDHWIIGSRNPEEMVNVAKAAALKIIAALREKYGSPASPDYNQHLGIQLCLCGHVLTITAVHRTYKQPVPDVPEFQIVMRGYKSVFQLLSSYDFATVRTAYDGAQFWVTRTWFLPHKLSMCIVDPSKATTIGRMVKQSQRGSDVCAMVDVCSDSWRNATRVVQSASDEQLRHLVRMDHNQPVGLLASDALSTRTSEAAKLHSLGETAEQKQERVNRQKELTEMYKAERLALTSDVTRRGTFDDAEKAIAELLDTDDDVLMRLMHDMWHNPCQRLYVQVDNPEYVLSPYTLKRTLTGV